MMLIRPATAADVHGIARVHVAAWHWAYAGPLPQAAIDERTFERRLARWTRVLGAPDADERVVVADDAILGFAAYGPARDGTGGEVYALYVDPEVGGNGAGTTSGERITRRARPILALMPRADEITTPNEIPPRRQPRSHSAVPNRVT